MSNISAFDRALMAELAYANLTVNMDWIPFSAVGWAESTKPNLILSVKR